MAEAFPDQIAFSIVDVGDLSFAEWEGTANALARGLVEGGLPPGGRVGLHLHTQEAMRWLISYAAIHRAGGVAVPMNPRLAPAEVGHMLNHSGADAVVADGDLVAQDVGVGSGVSLFVNATSGGGDPAAAGSGARVASWAEATSGSREAMQVPRESDDLADILYTSGTTGRPK